MTGAQALRDAALAVPGVYEMHAGPYGTAATYDATGRVWGIRVADEQIDVHVVALHGLDLRQLGDDVRAAVLRAADDYAGTVRVHVEDLVVPPLRPDDERRPDDEHTRRTP